MCRLIHTDCKWHAIFNVHHRSHTHQTVALTLSVPMRYNVCNINVVCTNVCIFSCALRALKLDTEFNIGESVTLLQLECTATHHVNQMREPSNVVNWIWTCFSLEWMPSEEFSIIFLGSLMLSNFLVWASGSSGCFGMHLWVFRLSHIWDNVRQAEGFGF